MEPKKLFTSSSSYEEDKDRNPKDIVKQQIPGKDDQVSEVALKNICNMQNQNLEEETLIEKIQTTKLEAAVEKKVGFDSDSISNFEGSKAAALEEKTQTSKATEQQKKEI
ncbi:Uncharacterized protein Fot_43105 [Forsythia ovata]|uniref:Uncharacterized protein n=1 Tax=Forsythia ovata TaxID=205694 RepID=A0ABD1RN37_9LAMI